LGTDAPSNNADMFEVMKFASILQKGTKLDISQMPFHQVLKMATNNGAKALGLENEIGSIKIGKRADLILVNLKSTRFEPVALGNFSNLLPNLVYSAHGDDVDTTIIDGEIVMEHRKLKTVNEEEIIENARKTFRSLKDRIF